MLHAQSLQSCPTLCDPMACSLPAPLSMGFSRQEHWSGLPLAFPGDLRDCSLQGSSVRGILQARILECFAIPSSRGSSRPMSLCPLHREAGFYHQCPLALVFTTSAPLGEYDVELCLGTAALRFLSTLKCGIFNFSRMLWFYYYHHLLPDYHHADHMPTATSSECR